MSLDAPNLVKWFQDRPFWIQELARHLLTKEHPTSVELSEFVTLCIQQATDSKTLPKLAALPESAFAQIVVGTTLRLDAISEIQGIDALNPRSPLIFNDDFLTIVYGGTGVGKSGYIRILNNVCGSKNRRKLLGNVFQGVTAKSCKVSYTLNGSSKEITWKPSDGLQAELAPLEIYDSECGQVYVNSENEVAFEPWLLGFFQDIIEACTALDTILADKIATLQSKKPTMPAEFTTCAAATWYARINALTSAADVAQWCDWSAAKKEDLENLQARLLEKNPLEQARQLRMRKAALDRLLVELTTIQQGLTDEVIRVLLNAKNDAAVKRKTASEDAEKVFRQAPLDGVGRDSWKLLWEQARAYSEGIAYLKKEFPFTGDVSRCVLCQQFLDEEAKLRLISFEKFVKGELESLAKKSEAEVNTLLKKLPKIPTFDEFATRLAPFGFDENLFKGLQQFCNDERSRSGALVTATAFEETPPAPNLALIEELTALATALETKAKNFDEDARGADKTDLKQKVRELEARKWLNEQKVSVEGEITRLIMIAGLEAARRLTNTMALSKKKSELAQLLVSDAFIQRFNSELNKLSAARIQVELAQTRTDKGHVFHQIRLKNAKIVVPTSDVLSEGERRVVSIAAFLADIEAVDASTPVVFDDPITSLDQEFEESVVARLVVLAKKRQVIVFTHRLSMLTQLEEAARISTVKTRTVALNREPWGTGEPSETPFSARTPEKVINGLLNDRLARARKIFAEHGKAEYDLQAKAICSDVRILVERLVEDTLLNDVVRRFRRAVHTLNKIGGLAKIKPQDCQMIDELMTKYSRYEHSQPNEAPIPLPEPDDIATDLTRLQAWLKEFSARNIPQSSPA
jgi:ABC-type lipoprotein export system ATPase subunit